VLRQPAQRGVSSPALTRSYRDVNARIVYQSKIEKAQEAQIRDVEAGYLIKYNPMGPLSSYELSLVLQGC
jgi:hypothetical protein